MKASPPTWRAELVRMPEPQGHGGDRFQRRVIGDRLERPGRSSTHPAGCESLPTGWGLSFPGREASALQPGPSKPRRNEGFISSGCRSGPTGAARKRSVENGSSGRGNAKALFRQDITRGGDGESPSSICPSWAPPAQAGTDRMAASPGESRRLGTRCFPADTGKVKASLVHLARKRCGERGGSGEFPAHGRKRTLRRKRRRRKLPSVNQNWLRQNSRQRDGSACRFERRAGVKSGRQPKQRPVRVVDPTDVRPQTLPQGM